MDYRLFKPTYTARDGRQATAERFYIAFKDHLNTRRRWPAFSDEKRSRAVAEKIRQLVEHRTAGTTPDERLFKWVEAAPQNLREKLSEAGLIETGELARREPLAVHLDGKVDEQGNVVVSGWRQSLLAGRSDREGYADLMVGRPKRVFDAIGLHFWSDLRAGDVETRIETYLSKLRSNREISGRTYGYYVREIKSFCRWMVAKGRAASMVLANLKAVNDADADTEERRAFTPDEMRLLLRTAATAGTWKGYEASERALLYRFAYETGLRPGTIRKLTVAWFDLEANPPTVTCPAGIVKRRKLHTQVLRTATAAELRERFKSKVPTAAAFPMSDKFLLARMLRHDLAAARAAWIAAAHNDDEKLRRQRSDFLADVDHQGHRADFYSLRHTHGTLLGDMGVPQKDIQASLHHTRSATTDRYVHADLAAKQKAVNSLPEVLPVGLKATGTYGPLSEVSGMNEVCLSGACATVHSCMDSNGQSDAAPASKNPIPDLETGFTRERDGTRTRNHRIDSPVL